MGCRSKQVYKSFLVFFLLFAASASGFAMVVKGIVTDDAGAPIPHVRITVAGDTEMVPTTVSVFSDSVGSFATPIINAKSSNVSVSAFRIGWEEISREVEEDTDGKTVNVKFRKIDNVAHQVPSSAWIPGEPGERRYHILINECAGCHQLGAERVKRFAKALHEQPLAAREAAWEAMVQYMRAQALRMGPSGHTELRWGLTEESPDYQAAISPPTSFFLPRDTEVIVPFLAEAFPTQFDNLTGYNDVAELGEYGGTKGTVIEEFALPTFGWTREVSVAPGSNKLWFLELDADRLGSLDPASGKVEWFDVPGEGPQGPHTLNADSKGNLWVALEESYSMAHFNTKTKEWKIYPPPDGVKFAITHDAALNSKRQVEPDAQGRVWLTLVGINELWSVHTETSEVKRYKMPLPDGEEQFHVFIYGAAMDPDGKRVWWTQLHGFLGAFNIETESVERIVPFPRGAAPRRLAIEEDGTLWVPLYGEGQLVKFDTKTGAEVARYDMPDRAGATYSVTLDPKRHAIWVGTTNSDRIYRFDIDDERWRHYPLPRKEAFLRMIEIDHDTGDVWTAYANLPIGKRDPTIHGHESANNMVVRLRPGD
ncbi:MAG: SMP-30/gluconolactonase/LRE family protein [Pseudomonadota bacterium]